MSVTYNPSYTLWLTCSPASDYAAHATDFLSFASAQNLTVMYAPLKPDEEVIKALGGSPSFDLTEISFAYFRGNLTSGRQTELSNQLDGFWSAGTLASTRPVATGWADGLVPDPKSLGDMTNVHVTITGWRDIEIVQLNARATTS